MTLYDCARLGGDCSSCLSANLGSGFQCLWCDRLDVPDTCTVFDFCKTHATLFSNITNCPLPTITYIHAYFIHTYIPSFCMYVIYYTDQWSGVEIYNTYAKPICVSLIIKVRLISQTQNSDTATKDLFFMWMYNTHIYENPNHKW